jgi:hypothetical protein
MQPLAIVPSLNILKDNSFGFCLGIELFEYTLSFQSFVKALHGGTIVAIPSPAHAYLTLVGVRTLDTFRLYIGRHDWNGEENPVLGGDCPQPLSKHFQLG